jgi:hypothetical protein
MTSLRGARWLRSCAVVFDRLRMGWLSASTQRRLASMLVVVFLVGLVVVEARRRGWLPEELASRLSSSHFQALHAAFTVLLLIEVITLVFSLARSVARATGMQLEIVSLILLRQSFKELSDLPEPVVWEQASEVVHRILSDAVGALLIFILLGVYYRLQRHPPITGVPEERQSFVATKKIIALVLLVCLVVIGVHSAWITITGEGEAQFFEAFYTLLIFADVLLVLISLRYNTAYHVVFRYFGFAVATVLIRIALTAPRVWDAGLALIAMLLALALTWAYNRAAAAFDPEDDDTAQQA